MTEKGGEDLFASSSKNKNNKYKIRIEKELNKMKKGFTIVELVIVIAVIAILAAVLIPTFSNVIAKANESAALQQARNDMTNDLVVAEADYANMTANTISDKQYYIVRSLGGTVNVESEKIYMKVTSSGKALQTETVSTATEGVTYYEVEEFNGVYDSTAHTWTETVKDYTCTYSTETGAWTIVKG